MDQRILSLKCKWFQNVSMKEMLTKSIPRLGGICLVVLKEFLGGFEYKIVGLFSIACAVTHLLSLRDGAWQHLKKKNLDLTG